MKRSPDTAQNAPKPTERPLPKGWRWVRLGEVCEPDRTIIVPGSEQAKRLPYLSMEHVEAHTGRILSQARDNNREKGKSATFAFSRKHVLYGKLRPYLNKVALPDYVGRCTTELIPLLPGQDVTREFLVWLLRRPETVLAAMKGKTGSRMPRANMDELLSLEVPLPPVAEQKRIVAILEEQLAAVDKARAAAEERLEAVRVLPAAYLREISGDGLAAKWPVKPLGEVCGFLDRQRIPVNQTERNTRIAGKKQSELYPYYGANGQVGWIDDFIFEGPAILLAEDGGKFGSRTEPIAYAVTGRYWVNNHAHILRPKPGMDFDFCLHALSIRPDVGELISGSTRPKLNQKVAASIRMPVPPVDEQKAIAARLNHHMEAAERLQQTLEDQLTTINAMPAALLRRAFNGEF